jgi:uncharacterized damage-inducible protein DinB
MTTPQQLATRFREVILEGKWIANTNWKEQVTGLTWQQATTQIHGLNSIALLTFHVHYYIAGILNVLQGGSLDIRDKYSFDMPPITSPEDWEKLQQQLFADSEQFAELVAQLSDNQLNAPFFDEKYSTYLRNIDGMMEHAYYHLGQVVLIRKMVLEKGK